MATSYDAVSVAAELGRALQAWARARQHMGDRCIGLKASDLQDKVEIEIKSGAILREQGSAMGDYFRSCIISLHALLRRGL